MYLDNSSVVNKAFGNEIIIWCLSYACHQVLTSAINCVCNFNDIDWELYVKVVGLTNACIAQNNIFNQIYNDSSQNL